MGRTTATVRTLEIHWEGRGRLGPSAASSNEVVAGLRAWESAAGAQSSCSPQGSAEAVMASRVAVAAPDVAGSDALFACGPGDLTAKFGLPAQDASAIRLVRRQVRHRRCPIHPFQREWCGSASLYLQIE